MNDPLSPGWSRQYWHNAEIELRHLGDLVSRGMAGGGDPTLRHFADLQDTVIVRETAIVRQHLDETSP